MPKPQHVLRQCVAYDTITAQVLRPCRQQHTVINPYPALRHMLTCAPVQPAWHVCFISFSLSHCISCHSRYHPCTAFSLACRVGQGCACLPMFPWLPHPPVSPPATCLFCCYCVEPECTSLLQPVTSWYPCFVASSNPKCCLPRKNGSSDGFQQAPGRWRRLAAAARGAGMEVQVPAWAWLWPIHLPSTHCRSTHKLGLQNWLQMP